MNGGWLTGKYTRDAAPRAGTRAARGFFSPLWWDSTRTEIHRKFDMLDALTELADEVGLQLSHLAVAFTLAHPAVSAAIIGPRTMEQLDDLLAGADVRLSSDVLDRIDALVPPGTDVDPANVVTVSSHLDALARRR